MIMGELLVACIEHIEQAVWVPLLGMERAGDACAEFIPRFEFFGVQHV